MNGFTARSSRQTSPVENTTAPTSAGHRTWGSPSSATNALTNAALNAAIPARSNRLIMTRHARPVSASGSRGIPRSASSPANMAKGRFTANTDRQPNQPISSPPSDGPIAIVAPPAIAIPPKTVLGGCSSPASAARRRISIIAVGYPADVPNPINTRAHTNIARLSATAPNTPPASTTAMPSKKTRLGPNSSASRPVVGCATAQVKYRLDMRIEVLPTGTSIAVAIATSPVAITKLLIGLRAAPKSIAVTNPAPKGFEVVATSRATGPPIASAYHLTRAGRRRDRSQPPPSSATRTYPDGARDTLTA